MYIDKAGLEARFGAAEIAELSGGVQTPIDKAIADAEATIDGYIASRYALPLAYVPSLVAGWAADIARFRLWDKQAPDEVRTRYEDAIAALKDLAKGLISLPPDAGGTPPAASFAYGAFAAERVFTADTLAGF